MAYLGWLFDEGKVGPPSIAHYVSANNTTLRALGLPAPADESDAAADRIKKARNDYKKHCFRSAPPPRVVMAFHPIYDIAPLARSAINSGSIRTARDFECLVFQFYATGNPSLPAAFNRDWVTVCTDTYLADTIPTYVDKLKTKDRGTLKVERKLIHTPSCEVSLHPITFLEDWMQLSHEFNTSYRLCLAGGRESWNQQDQNRRLQRALKMSDQAKGKRLNATAHSLRGGAASCAIHTGTAVPLPSKVRIVRMRSGRSVVRKRCSGDGPLTCVKIYLDKM